MRLRQIPWAIALVGVVLGLMMSMQFKVQEQVVLKDLAGRQRSQDLADQLEKAENERDALMGETEELRTQLRDVANSQAEYQTLVKQMEQAQLHAGLIPVAGPGVVVTMDDSARPVSTGENPNNFIIHDEDVLRVINELSAARAEAISINGQRVVGRTEIRCTGPVITINGVRTAPPLVITAIGNPADLEAAINMRGGIGETLKVYGLQFSVRKETALTVPAYKSSLKLQYATPAPQEVKP